MSKPVVGPGQAELPWTPTRLDLSGSCRHGQVRHRVRATRPSSRHGEASSRCGPRWCAGQSTLVAASWRPASGSSTPSERPPTWPRQPHDRSGGDPTLGLIVGLSRRAASKSGVNVFHGARARCGNQTHELVNEHVHDGGGSGRSRLDPTPWAALNFARRLISS